jgi:hypothetical protein
VDRGFRSRDCFFQVLSRFLYFFFWIAHVCILLFAYAVSRRILESADSGPGEQDFARVLAGC